jgi:hypothetical protein
MPDQTHGDSIQWTVHPVRESTIRAIIAIAAPFWVALMAHLWLGSWLWTILAFLLLSGSEFPFFVKTSYLIDAQGVTMKRTGVTVNKPWDQIRSFYPDKNGVQLSPYVRPFWMENFRGLYLQYGRHKEEILKILESKLGGNKTPVQQQEPSQIK